MKIYCRITTDGNFTADGPKYLRSYEAVIKKITDEVMFSLQNPDRPDGAVTVEVEVFRVEDRDAEDNQEKH